MINGWYDFSHLMKHILVIFEWKRRYSLITYFPYILADTRRKLTSRTSSERLTYVQFTSFVYGDVLTDCKMLELLENLNYMLKLCIIPVILSKPFCICFSIHLKSKRFIWLKNYFFRIYPSLSLFCKFCYSGKTYTLMADGCITEYAILELFEKISADKLHTFKVGVQCMNLFNSDFRGKLYYCLKKLLSWKLKKIRKEEPSYSIRLPQIYVNAFHHSDVSGFGNVTPLYSSLWASF